MFGFVGDIRKSAKKLLWKTPPFGWWFILTRYSLNCKQVSCHLDSRRTIYQYKAILILPLESFSNWLKLGVTCDQLKLEWFLCRLLRQNWKLFCLFCPCLDLATSPCPWRRRGHQSCCVDGWSVEWARTRTLSSLNANDEERCKNWKSQWIFDDFLFHRGWQTC